MIQRKYPSGMISAAQVAPLHRENSPPDCFLIASTSGEIRAHVSTSRAKKGWPDDASRPIQMLSVTPGEG